LYIGIIVLLLIAAVVALAIAAKSAIDAGTQSTSAAASALGGLQGVGVVDEVAQENKAKKAGKTEEAKELESIAAKRAKIFQTITAATNKQSEYYSALEKDLDASALRRDLEQRIPEAREALVELKTLTDREIVLIQGISGDEGAISRVKSFYKAMETAVNNLQIDQLSQDQMKAIDRDIQAPSQKSLREGREVAATLKPGDLDADQKKTLNEQVVASGKNDIANLNTILQEIPKLIQELTQSVQSVAGSAKNPLGMITQAASGKGALPKEITEIQGRLEALSKSIKGLVGEYSPFVDTVAKSAK
jgi:flagellar basal body-associated protein FliL